MKTNVFFADRLNGRIIRCAAQATSVILAVVLGLMGWKFLNVVRAPHDARPPPDRPAAMTQPHVPKTTVADAHIFGTPTMNVVMPVKTSLPSTWHVIGIIAASSPKDSAADIEIDGNEHFWHIGDRLPDGSTLVAIGDNSVTTSGVGPGALLPFELRPISHDDHFDTLPLDTQSDIGPVNGPVAAPTAHPADPGSVAGRLAALRAAGVADWLKRSAHPPAQSSPSSDSH